MKTTQTNILLIYIFLVFTLCSCKKFIEISPPIDQLSTEIVYTNDETATSAMRGIYSKMMSSTFFASGGNFSITLLVGRSADEFINHNSAVAKVQFSLNNLTADNTALRSGIWQEAYKIIYNTNSLLENLEKSSHISTAVKQQLSGEAKFVRAFCNFYLTNLFGEVPLILTTDYRVNSIAFASKQEQIYAQIIKDLVEAKDQLKDSYPGTERTRANKWAATALLSRTYLYLQQWEQAEAAASEIILKTDLFEILPDLNQVFLKNSKEAILQFSVPITTGSVNTKEGSIFILTATPGISTEVSLSPDFISSFEPSDMRMVKWVGTFSNSSGIWYYPFKYKIKSGNTAMNEYSMVIRLAELYLIRAEARINQGKIEMGISDLNILRSRARPLPTTLNPNPLPNLSSTIDKASALLAVEKERRIELFSEWGHRWLDLKRTNRANTIMSLFKGTQWQSTDSLYPIPASDILNDPNLKQNPGYN